MISHSTLEEWRVLVEQANDLLHIARNEANQEGTPVKFSDLIYSRDVDPVLRRLRVMKEQLDRILAAWC